MSKRIEKLIVKYLNAVDVEQSDDVTGRQEEKAIEIQFECIDKIMEFSKSKIKTACMNGVSPRVNSFYKMYIA